MIWKDLVVEEIRKYRDDYAKKFNYDLHKICQDIRKKQGRDGRRVVSLKPRPASVSYEQSSGVHAEDISKRAVSRLI